MTAFEVGDTVRLRYGNDEPATVMSIDEANIVVLYRIQWESGLNLSFESGKLALISRAADATETRTTSSTGAEKGVKAEAFSLLPVEALEKVARHYRIGAEKYAAHNWRAGYEWSKSYDALQRHAHAFWRGEDMDAETGSAHMAAVAFHALALLTFMDEQPGFDDRYKQEAGK